MALAPMPNKRQSVAITAPLVASQETFDDDFEFNGDFHTSVKNLRSEIRNSFVRSGNEEPVLVRLSDLAEFNISVNDIQASGMVFNSHDQKWEETENCCGDVDMTGFESTCSNCSWDEEFGFASAGDQTPKPLVIGPRGRKSPAGQAAKYSEESDLSHFPSQSREKMTVGAICEGDSGRRGGSVLSSGGLVLHSRVRGCNDGDDMSGFDSDPAEDFPFDSNASSSLNMKDTSQVEIVLDSKQRTEEQIPTAVADPDNYDDDFMDGFSDKSEDIPGENTIAPPALSDESISLSPTRPPPTHTPIKLSLNPQVKHDGPSEDIYDDNFDDDFASDVVSYPLRLPVPAGPSKVSATASDSGNQGKVSEFLRNLFKGKTVLGDTPSKLPDGTVSKSSPGPRLIRPEELQSLIAATGLVSLSSMKSGDTCSEDHLSDAVSGSHHSGTSSRSIGCSTGRGGHSSNTPSCTWDGASDGTEGTDLVENWDDMFEGDLKVDISHAVSTSMTTTMHAVALSPHRLPRGGQAASGLPVSAAGLLAQAPISSRSSGVGTAGGSSTSGTRKVRRRNQSNKLRLITPHDMSATAALSLSNSGGNDEVNSGGKDKGTAKGKRYVDDATLKESSGGSREASSTLSPADSNLAPSKELLMHFDSTQQKWVNRTDLDSVPGAPPPLEDIDWGDEDDVLPDADLVGGSELVGTATPPASIDTGGPSAHASTASSALFSAQCKHGLSTAGTSCATDGSGGSGIRQQSSTNQDSKMRSDLVPSSDFMPADVDSFSDHIISSVSTDRHERASVLSDFVLDERKVYSCQCRHDDFMRAFLQDAFEHLMAAGHVFHDDSIPTSSTVNDESPAVQYTQDDASPQVECGIVGGADAIPTWNQSDQVIVGGPVSSPELHQLDLGGRTSADDSRRQAAQGEGEVKKRRPRNRSRSRSRNKARAAGGYVDEVMHRKESSDKVNSETRKETHVDPRPLELSCVVDANAQDRSCPPVPVSAQYQSRHAISTAELDLEIEPSTLSSHHSRAGHTRHHIGHQAGNHRKDDALTSHHSDGSTSLPTSPAATGTTTSYLLAGSSSSSTAEDGKGTVTTLREKRTWQKQSPAGPVVVPHVPTTVAAGGGGSAADTVKVSSRDRKVVDAIKYVAQPARDSQSHGLALPYSRNGATSVGPGNYGCASDANTKERLKRAAKDLHEQYHHQHIAHHPADLLSSTLSDGGKRQHGDISSSSGPFSNPPRIEKPTALNARAVSDHKDLSTSTAPDDKYCHGVVEMSPAVVPLQSGILRWRSVDGLGPTTMPSKSTEIASGKDVAEDARVWGGKPIYRVEHSKKSHCRKTDSRMGPHKRKVLTDIWTMYCGQSP